MTITIPDSSAELGAPLLSLEDLTAWTRIPKSTLYSLISDSRGPRCFKIGRSLRFRATDVEEWLNALTNQRDAVA
jgi:excisionase family DNA binding protein